MRYLNEKSCHCCSWATCVCLRDADAKYVFRKNLYIFLMVFVVLAALTGHAELDLALVKCTKTNKLCTILMDLTGLTGHAEVDLAFVERTKTRHFERS